MEDSCPSDVCADSSTNSTRSGYPPGSPQPPITPPRRRSSLAFSRLFDSSTPSGVTNDETRTTQAVKMFHTQTPSNTSKKRIPAPIHRLTPTPGHVAQMQRLFQSAKASLRVDMVFAASPTGSIGSRLPTDNSSTTNSILETTDVKAEAVTPAQDWRYSTAPQKLAGFEQDVREPVATDSPTLPRWSAIDASDSPVPLEPMSSGFASPIDRENDCDGQAVKLPPLPTSRAGSINSLDGFVRPLQSDQIMSPQLDAQLEASMSALAVGSGSQDVASAIGTTADNIMQDHKSSPSRSSSSSSREANELFISDSAKAAADSARAKRGMLKSLFPWKSPRIRAPESEHHEAIENCSPSSNEPVSAEIPGRADPRPVHETPMINFSATTCPDPSLHQLLETGKCPDPIAHFRDLNPTAITYRGHGHTPTSACSVEAQSFQQDHRAGQVSVRSGYRTTASGSPMPFARPRRVHQSLETANTLRGSHPSHAAATRMAVSPESRSTSRNGVHLRTPVVMAGEHFQPGWYYTKEPAQLVTTSNPATYSFSTEAAKMGGLSAAPDSRIRDSYRTDTLTPLAKPVNRFRKTGVGALASARGVPKNYADGDDHRPSSQMTRTGARSPDFQQNVQFRTRSPFSSADMAPALHKRRRPADLEEEGFVIKEDSTADRGEIGPAAYFEQVEEVMIIDEDTKPAVRLSMYASDELGAQQSGRSAIKEISPNVTQVRKGLRQPRKKRRPSYWDNDLKQVRESPAARKVQSVRRGPLESLHRGPARAVRTLSAKEVVPSLKGEESNTTPEEMEMARLSHNCSTKENDMEGPLRDEHADEMEVDIEG